MKQVLLNPKSSSPTAYELPDPALDSGFILIENRASLISPGTERAGMEMQKASLLTKARQRPDLVQQTIHKIRTEGLVSTVNKIRSRLADPFAPGYSCAGEIIEIGPGVEGYAVGDRVAAAGYGYASHAELVSVPQNLTAKIPAGVTFAQAACGTLGAIALHGVRITSPALGETVAVVGLGILGQLTAQILQASGINVIAVEPDEYRRNLARENGIVLTAAPGAEACHLVEEHTGRRGADAVIITAATSHKGIIDESAELVRDRAIVTVVGDVPLTLSRRSFYNKELQLRLSRSYGPGRYDRLYEEMGHDYPLPYVRWTEQRNIEAFLGLLAQKKITVDNLITDRFTIDRAAEAYQVLECEGASRHLAVLFEYPPKPERPISRITIGKRRLQLSQDGRLGVGFVGFGQFAAGVLLPAFKAAGDIRLTGVATRKSATANAAASKAGFAFAATDAELVINNPHTDIVVVATTHNNHAALAEAALAAGKAVFLEKPIAIDPDSLSQLTRAIRTYGGLLQVGFNRRYSPALRGIKEALAGRSDPLSIDYRVCAGYTPEPTKHWVADPEIGGGRLIGETCHFIDAALYLTDALPRRVYARSLAGDGRDDAVTVMIELTDGSIVQLRYLSNAGPGTSKEHIDIVGAGTTAFVEDFRNYGWTNHGEQKTERGTQNKGHREQLKALVQSLRQRGIAAGNITAAIYATQATFAARESLRSGRPVDVEVSL